jgi:hypothetical protein
MRKCNVIYIICFAVGRTINKYSILTNILHIPDLILKLLVCIRVISLMTDKYGSGLTRTMERDIEFECYFLIICRYLNLKDNFIASRQFTNCYINILNRL